MNSQVGIAGRILNSAQKSAIISEKTSGQDLVQPYEVDFSEYDPVRYGGTLSAVGKEKASLTHTK